MKRLAATTALALALTAACNPATSDPAASPSTSPPTTATTDTSPRGEARAIVREQVPEWSDLTDEQFDNAAGQACIHLDEHPDDIDMAVTAVMTGVLDYTVDRSLGEYRNAAMFATWFAGVFDCVEHREAVDAWVKEQTE